MYAIIHPRTIYFFPALLQSFQRAIKRGELSNEGNSHCGELREKFPFPENKTVDSIGRRKAQVLSVHKAVLLFAFQFCLAADRERIGEESRQIFNSSVEKKKF